MKTEDDNIGAIENILGNSLVQVSSIGNASEESIDYCTDNNNNIVYTFLTDNVSHWIYKYEASSYTA